MVSCLLDLAILLVKEWLSSFGIWRSRQCLSNATRKELESLGPKWFSS